MTPTQEPEGRTDVDFSESSGLTAEATYSMEPEGRTDVDFSDWHDMPEPKRILTLSWEDIAYRARDRGMNLTREQVIGILEAVDANEVMMDGFWEAIDQEIDSKKEDCD